ncbi:hypothetical protein AHMF7605_00980 [Adhaeribacter arboris]|uniref:Uncharacterized protein n=1 Tax=Adhaeribacter arboris TaxID=2072846 RepID=A0A2T2Y9K0_9BACT|nr:hypothetical protein [Adhaeribacter arboris]PSR52192.1 hypothetical protein AHMF7605_00980 [Adhaeribacter arboris]
MKKTTGIFLILIFAFVGIITAFKSLADDKKPYLVKEFSLTGAGKLQAKTSGGSIKVTGGSGDQVKVKVFVTPANWKRRLEAPSPKP